ncbi:hypothetical protein LTR53_009177 [Teratosphaeriaceae sp. CCFEE 6253]|nr:hypothetical protein LTR53_009177 [Teratosphaeriaceae sp. CCFEE 6253]
MDAPVSGTKDGRDSIDPSGGQLAIGVLPVSDQLCGLCQTLRDDGYRYLLSTAPKDEAEEGRTVAHYASLFDLLRSAAQGCKLCRTFYDASVAKNHGGGGTTVQQWIEQTDTKAARNGYDVSVAWDAIIATRELGYNFLWIDSLCIVQDDEVDWQRQCSDMGRIYSDSDLTIACPSAGNAYEGFLRPRERAPAACTITIRDRSDDDGAHTVLEMRPTSISEYQRSGRRRHGPQDHLHRRGWVLQERLLSRRVLSFGSAQLIFKCDQTRWVEEYRCAPEKTFSASTLSKSCLYKSTPLDQYPSRHHLWYHIVEDYSACRLSAGDDILPALSGVANVFGRIADDTYLAGLWRANLPADFLWFRRAGPAEEAEGTRRPAATRYPGPTWSWAACRRPILFLLRDIFEHASAASSESLQYDVTVLGMDVRPAGDDAYRRVVTAVLSLRGPLMRCRLRYRELEGRMEVLAICDEDSGSLTRGWAESNARYGDWSYTPDALG